MKIGELAQADISLCRLRVAYILCQSWLADKGDNQSEMQPSWRCVSHQGPHLQSSTGSGANGAIALSVGKFYLSNERPELALLRHCLGAAISFAELQFQGLGACTKPLPQAALNSWVIATDLGKRLRPITTASRPPPAHPTTTSGSNRSPLRLGHSARQVASDRSLGRLPVSAALLRD
jgi:hypothetical protein